MIERLAITWEDASFAIIAAIAWLSASLMSCPQASVKFVYKAGVEITAAIPSLGPIMVMIEEDDRESQEDDLELCGLPGLRFFSPSFLALSQFTPRQSIALSVMTLAQHPLRC